MDMSSPKGDPTYIKNKDRYFIEVAQAISLGSTHPKAPAGCVIVRGRDIISTGRSLLTDSKVEVDCISYAIGSAARNGTAAIGGIIYTTMYPFSSSVFQAHMIGVSKFIVLDHIWEPYYKDEFRRAARLSRELKLSIEPFYFNKDPRFTKNTNDREVDSILYENANPFAPDEYDPNDAATTHNEDTIDL